MEITQQLQDRAKQIQKESSGFIDKIIKDCGTTASFENTQLIFVFLKLAELELKIEQQQVEIRCLNNPKSIQ